MDYDEDPEPHCHNCAGLNEIIQRLKKAKADDDAAEKDFSERETVRAESNGKRASDMEVALMKAKEEIRDLEHTIEMLKEEAKNYVICPDPITGEKCPEVERLRKALSFAKSCIKSGEAWSDTCERELKLEPEDKP